jgi:ATP-binding cassette, subfamily F, member 3
MILVQLDAVTRGYGAQPVLEGVSWTLHSGQKIGLVGPNGAGKSTLLKLIAEELHPETGQLTRSKGMQIGYLAQDPTLPEATVWEAAVSADVELYTLEHELRRLETRMADPDLALSANNGALSRTMEAYARAQERFERLDGYAHEARVRETLEALGFAEDQFDLPTTVLSGGQRKLVGLARLLVAGADLLLLDEPDNHLDLAGKEMLERFIRGFAGTVVLVSHDRYLLDETVDGILEVEDGKLTEFQGNYSAYAVEKELRLLRQQQAYQAQQKEIARIEAAAERFERWASMVVNERHARQARTRRRWLAQMERIDRPILERRRMGLELEGWRGSKKVLEIIDLDKVFGQCEEEQILFLGLNLVILRGERVGLLGPNGAGKSVLLRGILGDEPMSGGEIRLGPSVRIGYYAQRHETLKPDATLIDVVRDAAADARQPMTEAQATALLGSMLFPYAMCRKRVRELSGGERSRLQLTRLMLSDANLLLLDEPTNNLDLPSCEVLERALDGFQGTVLVVSHDRYLLDRVVDRVVELRDGVLTEYAGDYSSYRERRRG